MERGIGTQQQQGTLLSMRLYPKHGHSHDQKGDPLGEVARCCGSNRAQNLCSKARGPTAGMGEARSVWGYLG